MSAQLEVGELSRTESPEVEGRIAAYCAQTFGDDAVVREICHRDQSAVLERLRRHNSGPSATQ